MKTFRPYEPDQMLLMPPSLQDWVPEDHLARFISDLVNTLDLRVRHEWALVCTAHNILKLRVAMAMV